MYSTRIFSYYGNKSKVAPIIWDRVGDPLVYIEPFGGSIATLLERPTCRPKKHEVVGEVDCNLINFYLSVREDSETVWDKANQPTCENRLKQVNSYLSKMTPALENLMNEDVNYYDSEMAGYWLYRQCNGMKAGVAPTAQIRTNCIYNQADPLQTLQNMADRIRNVKFMQGDWKRTIYRTLKDLRTKGDNTFIFLDPPYSKSVRTKELYKKDDFDISEEVAEWAINMGKIYKICVAGLEGEHKFPDNWSVVAWNNDGGAEGRRGLERLWFSPCCVGE